MGRGPGTVTRHPPSPDHRNSPGKRALRWDRKGGDGGTVTRHPRDPSYGKNSVNPLSVETHCHALPSKASAVCASFVSPMSTHTDRTESIPITDLGEAHAAMRLGDPESVRAMCRSLERYGQLTPVVTYAP